MRTIRIEICKTDGLNSSTEVLHIDVPAHNAPPVGGPRALVVDSTNRAQLDELLQEFAKTAPHACPTIASIKFDFNVPA